jgi:two-component system OmpR family response regulator
MPKRSLEIDPRSGKKWRYQTMSSDEPHDDAGTNRTVRVLIVGNDPFMHEMVAGYLEKHNMRVVHASRRQDMVRSLAADQPDLVILDLRLGHEDGFALLREIRSQSDMPVIITSGLGNDTIDGIVGLELGADHCIAKPFSLRELLARIRAVLRRCEATRIVRDEGRGRFRFGGWQLDRRLRLLTNPAGEPVSLTKGEYALLTAFIESPQRPLSREYLLQATRVHEDIFDRSIDVQILRLRRRLEIDPLAPSIIQTQRGVGYVFALPVERA